MGVSRSSLATEPFSGFVGYFHFKKGVDGYDKGSHALRSVLAQLLHKYRYSNAINDIISFTMMDAGDGQAFASKGDLASVLRLCFNKLSKCYLVFDGLEECDDWEAFLSTILNVCTASQNKIVFIARPHLAVSDLCGPKSELISLESLENIDDIRSYLEPLASALVSKVAGKISADEVVDIIAERSNSMFLWAKLMVAYLQCPSLTPRDRAKALYGARLLDGLPAIFERILETIKSSLPRSQWVKVRQVFQWIAVARGPLHVRELQEALAVQTLRQATDEDAIFSFGTTLIQICCSLVEVRHDDSTVHFIHLSVLEYLVDLSEQDELANNHSENYFAINSANSHCYVATTCLLYLEHDVPHEPLSGMSSKSAQQTDVESVLPLARYAAQNWPWHIMESLQNLDQNLCQAVNDLYQEFLDVLDRVLRTKPLITVWIETCFTFGSSPNLCGLECVMVGSDRAPRVNIFEGFATTLAALGQCLADISSNWEQTLLKEPNEIWLPSINAFIPGEFLVGTDQMEMRSLTSLQSEGSILIASQVSFNGREVGVVRVWPPRLALSFCSLIFHFNVLPPGTPYDL